MYHHLFKKHTNLFYIGIISLFMIMAAASTNAQSINKTTTMVTVSYSIDEYEKAVKASAGMIPSKKTLEWTAEGKWQSVYSGSAYTLYHNGVAVYSSTTIAAIRAKYISVLLGIPMKIPS